MAKSKQHSGKKLLLLEDHVIPVLICRKYPKVVRWVDQQKLIFEIGCKGKGKFRAEQIARWNTEYYDFFLDWNRMNPPNWKDNPFEPTVENISRSKTRIINSLRKLNKKVKELKSPEKSEYRIYQLTGYTLESLQKFSSSGSHASVDECPLSAESAISSCGSMPSSGYGSESPIWPMDTENEHEEKEDSMSGCSEEEELEPSIGKEFFPEKQNIMELYKEYLLDPSDELADSVDEYMKSSIHGYLEEASIQVSLREPSSELCDFHSHLMEDFQWFNG